MVTDKVQLYAELLQHQCYGDEDGGECLGDGDGQKRKKRGGGEDCISLKGSKLGDIAPNAFKHQDTHT